MGDYDVELREVCGWRDPAWVATFGDGVRICSGPRVSHEGVVRDHEYEPVLLVPVPVPEGLFHE